MGRLTAIVLGAAGGGGFPQWNCRVPCAGLPGPATRGRNRAPKQALPSPLTASIGFLLNASPDLARAALGDAGAAAAARRARQSDRAVVLTGAEVDQIGGLLTLRERQAFTVFATADTIAALDANPIFGVLAADVVTRKAVAGARAFSLPGGLRPSCLPFPAK